MSTSAPTPDPPARSWLGLGLLASHLILLAALLGALFFADSGGVQVAPHPDHGSVLRVSGPASPSVIAWGYGLGLAILLLMTSCILLGVAKAGRLGRLGLGLAAGCFGLALVFTALVFTYARGASGLVAGFPLPTAWMLYGVWGFPSLMVLGFSWAFLRVWLTEDEVDRFRAALAERRGEPER